MGEGDRKHADRLFSMVICVTALSGLALGVLGIVLLRPVAELLGAEGELLENCVRYGRLILIANPAYVLQFAFQCLFATAGKPKLGLAVTVAGGRDEHGARRAVRRRVPLGHRGRGRRHVAEPVRRRAAARSSISSESGTAASCI